MSPLEIPDPVTIAFIGYLLAPITLAIKGIGSFAPQRLKPLFEQLMLLANLAIGGAAFAIWAIALATGNGQILPDPPTAVDCCLGASGLSVYVASIAYALIAYGLGRGLDAERWLTRWALIGGVIGTFVWALQTGLN